VKKSQRINFKKNTDMKGINGEVVVGHRKVAESRRGDL
jgi:hypothetical protein